MLLYDGSSALITREYMYDALQHIQQRIIIAAQQAGRDASQIRLIGVSKTHPAEAVTAALSAGLTDFGENRVQEAEEKITTLSAQRSQLTWHLIGHLQRNKAKKAVQFFDYIHSVDSLELAQALSRHSQELGLAPRKILLQCNVSGEESKEGIAAQGWQQDAQLCQQILTLAQQIGELPGVVICGLMTVAPYSDNPSEVREVFRSLRLLRDQIAAVIPHHPCNELSMGMSGDMEVAIAEGATMIRIGRALFGERSYPPQGPVM